MFTYRSQLALATGALLVARAGAAPQFLAPASLDRAPVVEDLFIEDVDRDGVADLVLRDGSLATLDWLKGTGGGDFLPPAPLALGLNSLTCPALGDIDGDGDRDLVYYDDQFRLQLVTNGASGIAGLPQEIGAPAAAIRRLFIADVDSDGDGDIVYLTGSGAAVNEVSVALNNGSSGFSLAAPGLSLTQGSIVWMEVGDLNGDEQVDLAMVFQDAAAGSSPSLMTALSAGGGSFGSPVVVDSIAGQTSVLLLADVNGDGNADISLRSSDGSQELRVYPGTGNGSFPSFFGLSTAGDRVSSLHTVDLDLDGTLDLVASTPTSTSGVTAQYFSGPVVNASATPLAAALEVPLYLPVFGDINGDGLPDAVGGIEGVKFQLGWLPHAGGGSPLLGSAIELTSLVRGVSAVAAGDLNGDGALELISSNVGASTLVTEDPLGPAYRATTLRSLSSSPIRQMFTVDLDADGRDDVVTVDETNTLRVNLSRADFDLVQSLEVAGVSGQFSVLAEDVVGDSALDLVGILPNHSSIVAFEGLGGGAFSSTGQSLTGGGMLFSDVRVVDVDGDGAKDLAATRSGFAGAGGAVWFRALGQGAFGAANPVAAPSSPAFGLEAADFSGDGIIDIVWGSPSTDEVRVALGLGGGQFRAPVSFPMTLLGSLELHALDFDLDGRLDLAARGSLGAELRVLKGDGTGSFTAGPALQSLTRAAAPVDLDADGDLDLLTVKISPRGTFFIENVSINMVGESVCGPAVANSTGSSAAIAAVGSEDVAANSLRLRASALPPQSFGLFLTSQTVSITFPVVGSVGRLCLGGSIGRFLGPGQVQSSGASGAVTLDVDLTDLPSPSDSVAASAGQTWAFQTWFRDELPDGSMTSNFTDAVTVTLQ